jgi:hypothetical protein
VTDAAAATPEFAEPLDEAQHDLAMLRELAQIGMDIARAVREQALGGREAEPEAAGKSPAGTPLPAAPVPSGPFAGADLGLVFSRVSRAVRQTLALKSAFAEAIAARAAEDEAARDARRQRARAEAERASERGILDLVRVSDQIYTNAMLRNAAIRAAFGKEATAPVPAPARREPARPEPAQPEPDAAERDEPAAEPREAREALADPGIADELAGRSFGQIVGGIRRDLGLPDDPMRWGPDQVLEFTEELFDAAGRSPDFAAEALAPLGSPDADWGEGLRPPPAATGPPGG